MPVTRRRTTISTSTTRSKARRDRLSATPAEARIRRKGKTLGSRRSFQRPLAGRPRIVSQAVVFASCAIAFLAIYLLLRRRQSPAPACAVGMAFSDLRVRAPRPRCRARALATPAAHGRSRNPLDRSRRTTLPQAQLRRKRMPGARRARPCSWMQTTETGSGGGARPVEPSSKPSCFESGGRSAQTSSAMRPAPATPRVLACDSGTASPAPRSRRCSLAITRIG
jgi:hypothetical protein